MFQAKTLSRLPSARHNTFCAYETERRPRGASQHKAAPTSVSGQSRLCLRTRPPCLPDATSRWTPRRSRAVLTGIIGPKQTVGAALCCEAPRGRRSISQAPESPRQAPLKANAISRQAPGSPDTTNNQQPKTQKQSGEAYRPPRFYIAKPTENHSALRVTRANDFLPAWHTWVAPSANTKSRSTTAPSTFTAPPLSKSRA